MSEGIQIVRADDPRARELESTGYRSIGESWGVRLRLPEPLALTVEERAVARAAAEGIVVKELGAEYADALFELELANNADYPYTPATFQAPPERELIRAFWESGKRVFGALDGDELVAAVVGGVVDCVGDNDFASVLRSHRGRGLGAAVAAAWIIALASDGVRVFAAGGANANDASLGLVRSLGFVIEEQWRSYQRSN